MTVYSNQKSWLVRAFVSMAFLAATNAQTNCIPLTNSKVCPSFKDFQVDTNVVKAINNIGSGMNFSAFTDVAGFDSAILGSGGFLTQPCSNSATNRIRYQNTILCTIAIQESKCGSQSVTNMCRTSCVAYAAGVNAANAQTCKSDNQATTDYSTLNGICTGKTQDWIGLQDTSNTCINATTNEASTCGFGSQDAMCTFCAANTSDPCCQSTAAAAACTPVTSSVSVSPTTASVAPPQTSAPANTGSGSDKSGPGGLSTAALGGIIGGGVAFIFLVFAIIICCIRKKKTPAPKKNLSRHISNSSTKYNISAPKMQEEGFAGALGAPAPIPMTALPSISASEKTLSTSIAAATVSNNRDSKASNAGGGKQYCQALYPYQASMADELDLNAGDIVNVHRVFDDGWAVGVNMNTSNEGAFPVVCVMFVDEASLEDDFEDVNMHSMTPMGHREDDTKGSSTPSRASSPVNLPRRQSSMYRDSAIIPGVNAPMTSSPLAGGNNNQRLQPPVRDTMMSDASSINRWWEGEK